MFFFYKQKTAYEMRISDWSSDVCSSDLLKARLRKVEEYAIPGKPTKHEAGPQRVFLPSYDFAAYWRFRAQADYMDYVAESKTRRDENGKPMLDDDGQELRDLTRTPLAGFRLAALTKITVQSWQDRKSTRLNSSH